MKKKVTLYITRHGETEYNRESRAQGWLDSPLTKDGREIAAKLGQGLRDIKFDAIYSSSAARARDTAKIVMDNMETDKALRITDGLKERGFGKIEGRIISANPWVIAGEAAAAAGHAGKLDLEALDHTYENSDIGLDIPVEKPFNMEEFSIFRKRLKESLDAICGEAADGDTILVVSHGMAILGMLYAVTGDKYAPCFVENASITLLENINGVYHVRKVNDKSYIEGIS